MAHVNGTSPDRWSDSTSNIDAPFCLFINYGIVVTQLDQLPYDALLIVSFGGPEKREDVIPFLENVLRGKPVPRERMLEVAEHYYHFDGVSPINAQVREFIDALKLELAAAKIDLPIYWGNRNWHPLLPDTLRQMEQDGVRRALSFMTSAYSSYSGCRQYRENVDQARLEVGNDAPQIDKIRVFYNHPEFVAANAERIRAAIEQGQALIAEGKTKADAARAIYNEIKDEPKEVITAAFVVGATLTEKGALTYWYNCRRKAAKEAARSKTGYVSGS